MLDFATVVEGEALVIHDDEMSCAVLFCSQKKKWWKRSLERKEEGRGKARMAVRKRRNPRRRKNATVRMR